MAEVTDVEALRKGGEYEVETRHRFRGRFVGLEKRGNTTVAVFDTGSRGRAGVPVHRQVPRGSFIRAAD